MRALETGGPPVGMFADSTYTEGIVRLNQGDLLVAYTDGVIEAANPAGKGWGLEGLRDAATESRAERAGDIVGAIFKSMFDFWQGYQADDATVAVVRVH